MTDTPKQPSWDSEDEWAQGEHNVAPKQPATEAGRARRALLLPERGYHNPDCDAVRWKPPLLCSCGLAWWLDKVEAEAAAGLLTLREALGWFVSFERGTEPTAEHALEAQRRYYDTASAAAEIRERIYQEGYEAGRLAEWEANHD